MLGIEPSSKFADTAMKEGNDVLNAYVSADSLVTNEIDFVVDSDPNKQGLFIPGSNIQVLSAEDAAVRNVDVIVILALSYREEIAALIKKKLPQCNHILTLDDHGEIIEI